MNLNKFAISVGVNSEAKLRALVFTVNLTNFKRKAKFITRNFSMEQNLN